MRTRTFDADGLKEIGTGLQIDPLNWPSDHSTEYLNLTRNTVFASIYHITLRFILFLFISLYYTISFVCYR